MNDALSEKQRLVLFKLLFTGEQPLQSKLRPELKPKERKQIIDAGLVQLEPRTRGRAVVLTDKAWEWASENLDAELLTPRTSNHATKALEAVLRQLKKFLEARSLKLADLFQVEESAPIAVAPVASSPGAVPLPEMIRRAYLTLSGNRYLEAIRIADLKAALPDIPFDVLDQTLLQMQQLGELSLHVKENARELTDADHTAAVNILGKERHLVYLER